MVSLSKHVSSILKSNVFFEEESKDDELSFYKGLAEKNMSGQQLSSMLAPHHSSRIGRSASKKHQEATT